MNRASRERRSMISCSTNISINIKIIHVDRFIVIFFFIAIVVIIVFENWAIVETSSIREYNFIWFLLLLLWNIFLTIFLFLWMTIIYAGGGGGRGFFQKIPNLSVNAILFSLCFVVVVFIIYPIIHLVFLFSSITFVVVLLVEVVFRTTMKNQVVFRTTMKKRIIFRQRIFSFIFITEKWWRRRR